jgi:ribose transport system ATP-binding protein
MHSSLPQEEQLGDRQDRSVILAVNQISKTFPGTRALADVSFGVAQGRVHGLLGGNGSGKSTLIKILAGVYEADQGGTLRIGDTEIEADSTTPALARAVGMRFVHQSTSTFGEMTIAENLAIGGEFPTRGPAVNWRALRLRTRAVLERFEIDARPSDILGSLRPADQARVAIARALQEEVDGGESLSVLVLDEPTASLPEHEVDVLLEAIRGYAANGQSILFVSHRLDEVLAITDEVTVLRDGRHIITTATAGLTEKALISHIVGRPLQEVFVPPDEVRHADPVLTVKSLQGGPLKDVSFEVNRGEILGIAGLLGSGRTEILQMIFGALRRDAGEVLLEDEAVNPRTPKEGMALGIAYVPEDREEDAAFLDMTVRQNFSAAQIGKYWRHFRLQHRLESKDARDAIKEFAIRTYSDNDLISLLSGGNQQKVILARWLTRNPKLLLLDEPTQGVDVGARADFYHSVREAVDAGTSVVLVCSDFEELAMVADRAVVVQAGRTVTESSGLELTRHKLTELVYTSEKGS